MCHDPSGHNQYESENKRTQRTTQAAEEKEEKGNLKIMVSTMMKRR